MRHRPSISAGVSPGRNPISDYVSRQWIRLLSGTLGGATGSGAPSPQAAQVLQGDLATGNKSGYTFAIVNCTKVTVNNQDMYTSYEATAVPQAVGKTGHRGFCIDQAGEIKADPAGGTNCTLPLQ